MKKIASFLLLFFVIISCTTEVTRNDPAFEGYKDDVRWRAKGMQAELAANQSVTIKGMNQFETVTLRVQSKNPGIYIIGENNQTAAAYLNIQDGIELAYATGPDMGDGEIEITEFDPITMKISGEFRFNAVNVNDNPLGGPIMNFQHGFFYNVPVIPAL